jgi:hypothetical protein
LAEQLTLNQWDLGSTDPRKCGFFVVNVLGDYMTESLKLFNVFGMVTVRHNRIVALATAILPGGSSCERTLARDIDPPLSVIADNKSLTLLFAASLRGETRAEVAVQQVSARTGAASVIDEPAVQSAIEDVIGLVRKAL